MIHVARVAADSSLGLAKFDRSFLVERELRLKFKEGQLSYEIVPVQPYKKTYEPLERGELPELLATFVAYVAHRPVGRIDVSSNWNGYAYVHDLVVEKATRRSGVACALIGKVIEWSQAEGLSGVMIETQSNNLPACKLYERCGFRLSGFDSSLYQGQKLDRPEVALFWYWHSNERADE